MLNDCPEEACQRWGMVVEGERAAFLPDPGTHRVKRLAVAKLPSQVLKLLEEHPETEPLGQRLGGHDG